MITTELMFAAGIRATCAYGFMAVLGYRPFEWEFYIGALVLSLMATPIVKVPK